MSPWPPEGEPSGKGRRPMMLPRPGHADLAGALKHGLADVRDAFERASARQTEVTVAAGAVAKALLTELGVEVGGSGRGRAEQRADGPFGSGAVGSGDVSKTVSSGRARCLEDEMQRRTPCQLAGFSSTGATGLEPATSGVTGRTSGHDARPPKTTNPAPRHALRAIRVPRRATPESPLQQRPGHNRATPQRRDHSREQGIIIRVSGVRVPPPASATGGQTAA
jgi:hypothetical protein